MALTAKKIRETYPLPVYNFRVTIHRDDEAASMSFAEVSGLSIEYEPVVYKDGLSFKLGHHVVSGLKQAVELTMRRGVFHGHDYLFRWLEESKKPTAGRGKRDVTIDLCDEAGTPVVRWKVLGALPTRLEAPSFNAETNEVAIEALDLVAHKLLVDYSPG